MSKYKSKSCFFNLVSWLILSTFFLTSVVPPSYAQNIQLPSIVPSVNGFIPAHIKGLTIHPENPLQFDFIVDYGQESLDQKQLRDVSTKLVKYFLASLTVPEDEMWVNLSPVEKNRIIPAGLGQTELGKDLLSQDFLLKKMSASLMSPDDKVGKEFWAQIRSKLKKNYGIEDIDVKELSKIWIVPDNANVYEQGNSVFVLDSHLKVEVMSNQGDMTESQAPSWDNKLRNSAKDSTSNLIREIILPAIEEEVNHGKTFANLRQIYNSMILAVWYKEHLKQSLLSQVYVDKNKVQGVNHDEKAMAENLYQQYLKLFRDGANDVIKEEYDPSAEKLVDRHYFTGGAVVIHAKDIHDKALSAFTAQDKANLLGSGSEKAVLTFQLYENQNDKSISIQRQTIFSNMSRREAEKQFDDLAEKYKHVVHSRYVGRNNQIVGSEYFKLVNQDKINHFREVAIELLMELFVKSNDYVINTSVGPLTKSQLMDRSTEFNNIVFNGNRISVRRAPHAVRLLGTVIMERLTGEIPRPVVVDKSTSSSNVEESSQLLEQYRDSNYSGLEQINFKSVPEWVKNILSFYESKGKEAQLQKLQALLADGKLFANPDPKSSFEQLSDDETVIIATGLSVLQFKANPDPYVRSSDLFQKIEPDDIYIRSLAPDLQAEFKEWKKTSTISSIGTLARHTQGVVATLIQTFHDLGIFEKLGAGSNVNRAVSLDVILTHLRKFHGADEEKSHGYLLAALSQLAAIGWIQWSKNDPDYDGLVLVSLTEKGKKAVTYASQFAKAAEFIDEAMDMMFTIELSNRKENRIDINPLKGDLRSEYQKYPQLKDFGYPHSAGTASMLPQLTELIQKNWGIDKTEDAQLTEEIIGQLNGFIVGPLMVTLYENGIFNKFDGNLTLRLEDVDGDFLKIKAVFDILAHEGFVTVSGQEVKLTSKGAAYFVRALSHGVPSSYYPSYKIFKELLLGHVDDIKRSNPDGTESLVFRTLNVHGSGKAHEGYFVKTNQMIYDLVNKKVETEIPTPEELIANKKTYEFSVADTGAGDGKFLESIYKVIVNHTKYGEYMKQYPDLYSVRMIGIDYNPEPRRETKKTLDKIGAPNTVIFGDINDPAGIQQELIKNGITKPVDLHVDSMLLHNRPYTGVVNKGFAKRRIEAGAHSKGSFVWRGRAIPNGELEQNLFELFQNWRKIADQMVVIELHTITEEMAAGNLSKTLDIAYRWSHALSDQLIVEQAVFSKIADEAGFQTSDLTLYPAKPAELSTVSVRLMTNKQTLKEESSDGQIDRSVALQYKNSEPLALKNYQSTVYSVERLWNAIKEREDITHYVFVSQENAGENVADQYVFDGGKDKPEVIRVAHPISAEMRKQDLPTPFISTMTGVHAYLRNLKRSNLNIDYRIDYKIEVDTYEGDIKVARIIFDGYKPKDSIDKSILDAVKASYKIDGKGDEFIKPIVVADKNGQPVGRFHAGDSVIFWNYRGDRPQEIIHALTDSKVKNYADVSQDVLRKEFNYDLPDLHLNVFSLTDYLDGLLPSGNVAVENLEIKNNFTDVVSAAGLTQYRTAETEKFNHVTKFFNSLRDTPAEGETWHMVPSPKEVGTYDLKPEMSADKVTDDLIERINKFKDDVVVVNYANPDMVGHTGNFNAVVKAVEAVDRNLGRAVKAAKELNYNIIVTADHGNAEQMYDKEKKPITNHTTNLVPFVFIPAKGVKTERLNIVGKLANIAPTMLDVLGLSKPQEMNADSLLKGFRFSRDKKQKVMLIILDGWGHNPMKDSSDAVFAAKTPVMSSLEKKYPLTYLRTNGLSVGLPGKTMGNSEVGHLSIGAGRVVDQPLVRIDKMIEDGSFFENKALLKAMVQAKMSGKALHLVGLVSDGMVHASLEHLNALLKLAKNEGLKEVYIHAITDGRDTNPKSGVKYIEDVEKKIKEIGVGKIVDVVGRYYAMDRDNRWERVKLAYDLYVHGTADTTVKGKDKSVAKEFERLERDLEAWFNRYDKQAYEEIRATGVRASVVMLELLGYYSDDDSLDYFDSMAQKIFPSAKIQNNRFGLIAILQRLHQLSSSQDEAAKKLYSILGKMGVFTIFKLESPYKIKKGDALTPALPRMMYLDLASGFEFGELMRNLDPKTHYVAVDQSRLMVASINEVKRQLKIQNVDALQQDIMEMKKPTEPLGTIRMKNTWQFVPKIQSRVIEMSNWLEPGGQLVIQNIPNLGNRVLVLKFIIDFTEELINKGWNFEYTLADFKQYGFDHIILTKPLKEGAGVIRRASENYSQIKKQLTAEMMRKLSFQLFTADDKDAAIINQDKSVGGINLDRKYLNLQIRRDGKGIPLPVNQQPIQNMKIDGFMPVIINIQMIPDFPLYLGFNADGTKKDQQQASKSDVMEMSAATKEEIYR